MFSFLFILFNYYFIHLYIMYVVAAAAACDSNYYVIIIKHDEGVGSRHEMPRPHALIYLCLSTRERQQQRDLWHFIPFSKIYAVSYLESTLLCHFF